MANLLDTIRNNSQQLPEQGVTDQTNKLQGLLRAKSGRDVGGSAVTSSNLGEQQAVANTNQTMQNQVQPQAQIQNAQLQTQSQGIQQAQNEQTQSIAQTNKFNNLQNKMRTQQLLNDLQRDRDTLDVKKDSARLEQLATSLRLQDQQYVDNLQREGSKRRLDDSLEFQQALTQTTFDNQAQLIEKNLDGQSILNANNRDFAKAMAQMGADDAYAMFRAAQQTQQQQQMWQSIGALGTAGIGAYGTYANSQAKPTSAPAQQAAAPGSAGNETLISGG